MSYDIVSFLEKEDIPAQIKRFITSFILTDLPYLGPALFASMMIFISYLLTHPFPGFGGGLFIAYAQAIIDHNYLLPKFIQNYGPRPLPFAYPPLGFYVIAIFLDIFQISPVELTRILPGLVIPVYIVAGYYLMKEWLSTRLEAGIAALMLATLPDIFLLRLTAGGIVRAPALVVTLIGLYFATKLFKTHATPYLYGATIFFAITILYHPVTSVFYGISTFIFWLMLDQSRKGFVYGAVVGFGGLLITSPWWIFVGINHGWDVFLAASQTHQGLAFDPLAWGRFVYTPDQVFPNIWYTFVLIGLPIAVAKRRWALLVWFIVPLFLLSGHIRMSMTVGSAFAGLAVGTVIREIRTIDTLPQINVPRLTLALIMIYVLLSGMAFAANYPYLEQDTTQSFIDHSDMKAIRWVQKETPKTASFIVIGDIAEWFPALSERASLNTWEGQEWISSKRQKQFFKLNRKLAQCPSISCIDRVAEQYGFDPRYYYIPKDKFSNNWETYTQSALMRKSIVESRRFEIVYENQHILIVKEIAE